MNAFKCVQYETAIKLGKIDNVNATNFSFFKDEVSKLISSFSSDPNYNQLFETKKILNYEEFFMEFKNTINLNCHIERFELCVSCLYVLDCLSKFWEYCDTYNLEADSGSGVDQHCELPLSLQHQKWIQTMTRYVMSSLYMSLLNEEGSLYLRKKYGRDFARLCLNYRRLNSTTNFSQILGRILKIILNLDQVEVFRLNLKKLFFVEILIGLLQMSFSPEGASMDKSEIDGFRSDLEKFLLSWPKKDFLTALLLLESLAALKKNFNSTEFQSILEGDLKCICPLCKSDPNLITMEALCGNRISIGPEEDVQNLRSPKKSNWFQNVCRSIFVRRFLLVEGGLKLSIETLKSTVDLSVGNRAEIIASFVSSAKLSRHSSSAEAEFYASVCPQIVALLEDPEYDESGFTYRILSHVIQQLSKRSLVLTQEFLIEPLLAPLSMIVAEEIDLYVLDVDLVPSISTLYKLFVQLILPEDELHQVLDKVVSPLLEIAALPPTCHVKTKAQLILVRYLSQKEIDVAVRILVALAKIDHESDVLLVRPQIMLKSTMNELKIKVIEDSELQTKIDNEFDELEIKLKCLIEVVEKMKSPQVLKNLVGKLASSLDFSVLNDFEVEKGHLLTKSEIGRLRYEKIRKPQNSTLFLNCVCDSEVLTKDLFTDVSSAVPLLKMLLETKRQKCDDLDFKRVRDAFVESCVLALAYFVNDHCLKGEISRADWRLLSELAPIVKELNNSSQNPAFLVIAEGLLNAMKTYGCVTTPNESKNNQKSSKVKSSAMSYEKNKEKSSKKIEDTTKKSTSGKSPYQEALEDICSSHLPVRGHALISFTKLIEAKDKEALRHQDKIFGFFELHLRDQDSYIYLSAIEGMVALSSFYPDKVVNLLIEEFSLGRQTVETKLKLTEILTKTCRKLGPLLPKYKNVFLNCLLNGVKDPDPLIRAACFSNLGEVCKELRFSVQPILEEIFSLVQSAVDRDKSPEVKRAAVLLVTLLLRGLGTDSMRVLQNVMLRLYRSLKQLISTHPDEVLVTQAELAMEEINSVTRQFLVPKMEMTKKIYIADIPQNWS